MRHLRDDTVLILDGEVRVYRRERSKRWQAAFSIDGKPIRISTGKKDLNEVKEIARDTYLEYKFRHKNDLTVITKKFSDVARLAIADMRKQLDAGLGKKVYADYIVCIERYLLTPTVIRLLNNPYLSDCIQTGHTLPHQHLNLPQLHDNIFRPRSLVRH